MWNNCKQTLPSLVIATKAKMYLPGLDLASDCIFLEDSTLGWSRFASAWGDRELRPKSEAIFVFDFRFAEICEVALETSVWVEGFAFEALSTAFRAKAYLPSGNNVKYSLKWCLFMDSGALVAVSRDMLFTIHAEYPSPFSTSHWNVWPLNWPNCISNWPRRSDRSAGFPPSRKTSALALASTTSGFLDT